MPEISQFYGIIIYLYFKDHNPPHIHAAYGDFEAKYTIESNEMFFGNLPIRADKLVREWIELHQVELMEDWKNALSGKPIFKITPLK